MLGVLWMLAWLGVSAAWQQRSFWTAENLMASVFYGANAIRSGFAGETLPGLAVYLVLYSMLGAFLATARSRPAAALADVPGIAGVRARLVLSLVPHWIWKSVMPLVALLHVEGIDSVWSSDLWRRVGPLSGVPAESGRRAFPHGRRGRAGESIGPPRGDYANSTSIFFAAGIQLRDPEAADLAGARRLALRAAPRRRPSTWPPASR